MEGEYVNKLHQWIDYDNAISRMKDELAKLNESKKVIEDDVIKYVEEKELLGVSVSTSDGLLKFPKRKVQQGMTMKYVKTTLQRYNDEHEENVDVEQVCKYLSSHLETKQKTYIKRDYKEG
jgi:hypothetical protein